jgi:hypothetical protein
MSDHDELKVSKVPGSVPSPLIKMPNFFPTSQPVSLRLKAVKFTGLQVPRGQLGVAFPFCERVAVPCEVCTSPFSQVAHLSQP